MISITCLCGSNQYESFSKDSYLTTVTGAQIKANSIYVRCTKCGLVRQAMMPFGTEEEYAAYYKSYAPSSPEYIIKDWEHDLNVARLRCDVYESIGSFSGTLLDVGSGSGAFVYESRQRGLDSCGCEIAKYSYEYSSENIYRKALEAIAFPTDHFDWVVCHDVLEHSLNPLTMLKEMFRIVKQQGRVVIDFPRFHNPAGDHHWKDKEHLWFPTEEQLFSWIRKTGFEIDLIKNPIESKIVVYARKPEQVRKSILVAPGIGDSYWSIVRLESFLAKEKIDMPEVVPVTNSKSTQYNAHERSVPFLQLFPFLHCDHGISVSDVGQRRVWIEAYLRPSRTIWKKVLGHDYFLSWNGHLRIGTPLEKVDPSIACNWHPKMFVSLEEDDYKAKAMDQLGSYIVCYFPFYGTYSKWTAEFPIESVVSSIKGLADAGYTPVLVGAAWDKNNAATQYLLAQTNAVDLTGQTSITQLFGLLKGAAVVLGYPSGLTIMAGVFGVRTLIIWNKYYDPDFQWNTLPPDVRKKTYFVKNTCGVTSDKLITEVKDLAMYGSINPEKRVMSATQRRIIARQKFIELRQKTQSKPVPLSTLEPVVPPKLEVSAITNIEPSVTVMCVLKSGGRDYNVDYVVKLRNMIARHTTIPYKFVCLTDTSMNSGIETIPLTSGLSGWWNKLEMFVPGKTLSEYIVYFDLDTLIVSNIDDILRLQVDFAALGGWHPSDTRGSAENFGSGMMIWKNDGRFSYLFNEYSSDVEYKRGDQQYIVSNLISKQVPYHTLQDLTTGIYSYKRNCLKGVPQDAKVICFHGRPRPHEAQNMVRWVRSYWR
jgi:SAM-dependent methyltransferase